MYLILNEEHFTFHLEQSSRENATPSSGTTPLASYKEVPSTPPPPPPPRMAIVISLFTSLHDR